jgi:hypothetical protein
MIEQHSFIKFIMSSLRKPSAEMLAQQEYENARRSLLECQRMRDYYDNMTNFHTTRINRVKALLANPEREF